MCFRTKNNTKMIRSHLALRILKHAIIIIILTTAHCKSQVTFGIISRAFDKYEEYIAKQVVKLATQKYSVTAINISFVHTSLTECNPSNTIGNIVKLIQENNAAAIIGTCSGTCSTAIDTSFYYNRLLISPGCRSVTSDSHNDHLLRTRPFAREHSEMIANITTILAKEYHWRVYGIVFSADSGWTNAFQNIKNILESNNIDVASFAYEAYGSAQDLLNDIKKRARIILLLTPERLTAEILHTSYLDGITNSHEYQFLTTDFSMLALENYNTDCSHECEIINGVIDIGATQSSEVNTIEYQEFIKYMNQSMHETFPMDLVNMEPDHLLSMYEESSYLYDAIMVYLNSLEGIISEQEELYNKTMMDWMNRNITYNNTGSEIGILYNNTTSNSTQNQTKPEQLDIQSLAHNTQLILQYVKRNTFQGLSGSIRFNNHGTRNPVLKIRNFFSNHSHQIIYDNQQRTETKILWLGGTYTTPLSIPVCGFNDECSKSNSSLVIIIAITIPCSFLVLFIIYRLWKKQKYDNDINNKVSFLRFEDFKATALLTAKPTINDVIDEKGILNEGSGVRSMKVYYNNKKYMLKKLPVRETMVSREVMLELKHLRDLKHTNINGSLGVTTRPPNICILQEWCKKGSLYDILNNEEIQLDWVFKHAFIWDIINGMLAIHDSPIKLHGHLTSRNCLINHRWVVQIADFGLNEFKKVRNLKDVYNTENEQAKYDQLLWTAPENINFPYTKSRAGDIYSFGVIVSEVINRQGPFGAFQDMKPSDIIHYVKKRCIPPFRPHVTIQTGLDERLIDMMKRCWQEWPEDRPQFREIRNIMNNIRGEGADILDNMIEMMERYSRDLDKTAKERTEMYRKEKIKSNELLYRCVPKPIASELLEGSPIYPEEMKNITLLLIKIDEFTELLDWLSPQQIIDVLNDFYRMCDLQINPHKNVYKLLSDREEVIYVSSLSCYKDISDTSLMAGLAIKIAKASVKYRWRHLGETKLKFKVTLHSGPAHGVIVGMKIPIYTLFGLALDYIRLLTKYTPVNKIVVTEECGLILRMEDDFLWKALGEVEVNDEEIGEIKPQYLTGSISLGTGFPELKPEDIEESESEPSPELTDSDTDSYPVPRKPYWDVSSTVETAFNQWFKIKEEQDFVSGPVRNYNKNPFTTI